jgi:hypothetical protein
MGEFSINKSHMLQVQFLSQQREESPEDQDLDLIQSELEETIGRDQLEEKLARMRTKSESKEGKMSEEASLTTSPKKIGSNVHLNSSQESLRKRLSRQASEIPKDEKKSQKEQQPDNPKSNEKQVSRLIYFLIAFHSTFIKLSYLYVNVLFDVVKAV